MAQQAYGKWQIEESLGEGGQAHTFIVSDTSSSTADKRVLKRLKNVNRIERFENEIKACAKLNHPNVLKLIDYQLDGKNPYMVTEYCHGGTLSEIDLEKFTIRQKLDLFVRICDGVAHAHSAGVTHRDIKPQNIFLKDIAGTHPIVGDFGVCLILDEEGRFTLTDEAVGARNYMAPELEDGRADDVKPTADIYSLGKLLYWLLTKSIFSREKHRLPQYDLGEKLPLPTGHLINELLDKMIVAEPNARIPDATILLAEVGKMIHALESRAHVLDLKVPQHCVFCATGYYKAVVNYAPDHPQKKQRQRGSASDVRNFGFEPIAMASWLILACDKCGNIQAFRPDTVGGPPQWKNL